MTPFAQAVLDQPENLQATLDTVTVALAGADLTPWRSGTVVVGAIGASHHAAIPFAAALRAAGRRAFLLGAEELAGPTARALGDAFVLVSQSGRSAETLAALEALQGAPCLAVSARTDSPLPAAADIALALGPAVDTPVATLSYTATLLALGRLGEALTEPPDPTPWARVPELAAGVLADAQPAVGRLAQSWGDVRHVDAVGDADGRASAAETVLLVREGLGLPTTGMGTREYLHGPMESVGDGLGAIVFGGQREVTLAADLRSFGAQVALVGPADVVGDQPGAIGLPDIGPLAAAILQILPVQMLAHRLAEARGLEIGALRRSQPDTKVPA